MLEDIGLKKCTACGLSLPATNKYYGDTGHGTLRSECMECRNEKSRNREEKKRREKDAPIGVNETSDSMAYWASKPIDGSVELTSRGDMTMTQQERAGRRLQGRA